MFPFSDAGTFGLPITALPDQVIYGMPQNRNVAGTTIQAPPLLLGTQFDGVNDFADVTGLGLAAPAEFTAMGWFVATNLSGLHLLLSTELAESVNGFRIWFVPNLRVTIAGASVIATDFVSLNVNRRYHIAVTITGGTTLRLFLDGALLGTINVSTALPTAVTRLRFGGGFGSQFFAGRIAAWSVYQRALSAGEIRDAARPTAPYGANTQSVVGIYPFTSLEPLATQSPDVSGNSRHLTLTNMPANPIVLF